MNVPTYPHTYSLYQAKTENIFPYFWFNFGRSALVNAAELHKNKMQVDFHLTFTGDTKLKQNVKTVLVEK